MEAVEGFPFATGQRVESKSNIRSFRGAWFRSEVHASSITSFQFLKRQPRTGLFQKRGSASRWISISYRCSALSTKGCASVFPRINVRDPYKVLGVGRDASEEEIQSARNFLADQYANHERSREAVEAAHDKIIMESFRARKKSKINLKSNLKKKVEESPPWVRNFLNIFEVPPSQVILQRAVFFALMGVWSVMNPAEGGPAFQVAVSLAGCIYLLNYRLKSIGRSFVLGFGGLVVGWLLGSFLVPFLPTAVLPPNWSLEILTALISYVFMWLACTFFK